MTASDSERSSGVRIRSAWLMTSSTSLLIGVAALIVSPVAARLLGTEGRGRLVAVQLVPQLLAELSALGMGFAIIHFGARHRTSIARYMVWAVKVSLVGSVVMFTLGQLLAPYVAGSSSSDERLFRIYMVICPITALMVVGNESLRAVGDFRRWNIFVLARGLSWPTALLVGVTLSDDPLGTIVGVHLALASVLLVVLWGSTWPRMRTQSYGSPVTNGEFNRYGLAAAVSTIPRSANAKLDQVVMTFVVGRENLGLYAAAVGWSGLTVPVMRGLSGISMPHVSSAADDQQLGRVRQLITLGLIAILLVGIGGVTATYLLWFPLYGDEFASARMAAMVLILAGLFLEFNAVLSNVLRSLDRPNLVSVLEVLVLVISTSMLLVVLGSSQVLGPALLSLGTYLTACVLYAGFIARQLDARLIDLVDVSLVSQLARRLLRRADRNTLG